MPAPMNPAVKRARVGNEIRRYTDFNLFLYVILLSFSTYVLSAAPIPPTNNTRVTQAGAQLR